MPKDAYFQLLDHGFSQCDSLQLKKYCKALNYFKTSANDSCFITSQSILLEHKKLSKENQDLLKYISGVSALNQRLYLKALQIFKSVSKEFRFKHLLNYKFGIVYVELEDYDKAILVYRQWLKENPEGFNVPELKAVYHNLATAYLHNKEYTLAKTYYTKRLHYARQEKDTAAVVRVNSDLGNLFYVQNKHTRALPYFKAAYTLAQKHPNLELKQSTSQNMAVVEKNNGNYKKSVAYYQEHLVLKDSIWNRDRISELLEKDKQQALAIKEKEILLEKAEKEVQKKQRNWFLGGAVLFLSSSVLIFSFYQNTSRQKKQLDKLNALKDFLFSVVSHDLRSPIHLIKSGNKNVITTLEQHDASLALKYAQENHTHLEHTSHLLNNILNWTLKENNQLLYQPEIHHLPTLITTWLYDVKNRAKSKKVAISTNLSDESVACIDKELIKIVFRNLLDNALKYIPTAGKIAIKSSVEASFCELIIADNGPGIPFHILKEIENNADLSKEKVNRSKGVGLGLILCKHLVNMNKGSLNLKNNLEGKGLTVTIKLPTTKN